MAEIKLNKRVVYAGDVHIALLKAGWGIQDAVEFVNGLQAVDAVPREEYEAMTADRDSWEEAWAMATNIVRCGECKHSRLLDRTDLEERQYAEGCLWCMVHVHGVEPNEFCSEGECGKWNG